jgi:hypothetical protein
MKKIIIFTVLSFIGLTFHAQVNDFNPGNSPLQLQTRVAINTDIEGSPYFEDKFLPGIIEELNGNSQNAYLRYNVKNDEVEVKAGPSQKQVFILPRQEKFVYKLKDYSYVLGTYNVRDEGLIKGFVANYYESENLVFIGKPFTKISEAQPAKTAYEKATPATLYIGIKYYLSVNGEQFQEVKLKDKDFKNLLDDSSKTSAYLKDHKIKEIEDIVKLLEFYDSKK